MRKRQIQPQQLKLKVWSGMAAEGSLDLTAAVFLPNVGLAGVLKSGDDLVDGVAQGLTDSSKCRPLVVVSVAGTVGLLERVFKTFL